MARVFIGTRVSNNGSIFSKSALRAGYINSITIILDVTAEAGRPPKFLFNRPRMAFPLTEAQMHGPKAFGSSDTKSGRKGGVVRILDRKPLYVRGALRQRLRFSVIYVSRVLAMLSPGCGKRS